MVQQDGVQVPWEVMKDESFPGQRDHSSKTLRLSGDPSAWSSVKGGKVTEGFEWVCGLHPIGTW